MDPSQIPLVVHSMQNIATGIEAQTTGLNPATTIALKALAKDLRALADRIMAPGLHEGIMGKVTGPASGK